MTRDEILEALHRMLPTQFEELMFRMCIPAEYLSGTSSPQSLRAIEAIRYLEGQGRLMELGARLSRAWAPARTTTASTNSVPAAQPSPALSSSPRQIIRCFVEFARGDQKTFERLAQHLKVLQRKGNLNFWDKTMILPGASWQEEVERRFDEADLFLVLVSAELLASDESYALLERALAAKHIQVVPVLVSPCAWESSPVAHLQVLPRDKKPVSASRDTDEALQQVAAEIARLAQSHHEP